jgi:hypothetical protein
VGTTIPNTTAVAVTAGRLGGANCATPAQVLCENSFNPSTGAIASIFVNATYPAAFILPVPIGPTLTLNARAVYRCEFN